MIKCQDDKKWSHYGKCRVDGIYKYFKYLDIYLLEVVFTTKQKFVDSHLTQVCLLSHPRGF